MTKVVGSTLTLFGSGQAHRQDFAAGGQKSQRGPHIWNTILDVCSNRGVKDEMGSTGLKRGGWAPLAPAGDGPGSGWHSTVAASETSGFFNFKNLV